MTNPNIIDEDSRNFTNFHQSEPVVVETIEMPDETLLIHEEPMSNVSCECFLFLLPTIIIPCFIIT